MDLGIITLGVFLAGSTAADTITTRQALSNPCQCIKEANPLMKPFAGSTARLTAAQAGLNSAVFLASMKYKREHRKIWWVPIVAGIGMHSFAAWHNSRLVDRQNTLADLNRRLFALESR